MVSVGQYQGKHYFFILDIHPLNSGNCRNLSHLTYHATLAPSSTLFLSIIVIVSLQHRHCSSPSSSDTHHPGSNRLGRGSNSKTSRNSEILRTNIELKQGARCRRLESQKSDASSKYCCRGVGGGI